ncbi:unnamed protein product, partial [Iphiclides podalirius]
MWFATSPTLRGRITRPRCRGRRPAHCVQRLAARRPAAATAAATAATRPRYRGAVAEVPRTCTAQTAAVAHSFHEFLSGFQIQS